MFDDIRMWLGVSLVRLAVLRVMPMAHQDTPNWLVAAGMAGRLSLTRAAKARLNTIEGEAA